MENSERSNAPLLTPAAQAFIRRMVRFGGKGPGAGFRLEVSPGGCSGMSSRFSVESEPSAGDEVLGVEGLRLFIPAASYRLLEGVTVDFVETRMESGLAFIDPKAGACACSSGGSGGRAGA